MIYVKTVRRGEGKFAMDIPVLAAASREKLDDAWIVWLSTVTWPANFGWVRDEWGQLVTATTILEVAE